jgi:glycosyltransferase involved in cell wall biosynthesis
MSLNQSKAPLLSVFTVTYNHEQYIAQTIESVLAQKTSFPFEYIIGEDFSTDKTREIVKGYAEKYPDIIKVLLPPANLGMMQNCLNTFKECKGKYLALVDGDDYWTDPYKLQKQVDILEANPDISLCFHNFKIQKNDNIFDNTIAKVPAKISTQYDICKQNYIQTCSVVCRNIVTNLPSWYDTTLNAGDYPLYMLLAEMGNFYYLDECMCIYRIHPGGIYTNSKKEFLLKGNIHLLQTLSDNLKDKIVKRTLIKRANKAVFDLFKEEINNKSYSNLFKDYRVYFFKLSFNMHIRLIGSLIKSIF